MTGETPPETTPQEALKEMTQEEIISQMRAEQEVAHKRARSNTWSAVVDFIVGAELGYLGVTTTVPLERVTGWIGMIVGTAGGALSTYLAFHNHRKSAFIETALAQPAMVAVFYDPQSLGETIPPDS